MPLPRLTRRLLRHHLPLALATAAALALMYRLAVSENSTFRWSMATAYVGLALIGVTLLIGPLRLLQGRRSPASTDLRRDIGIWAALVTVAHVLFGIQVHMKSRWYYFFRDRPPSWTPRTDLFGLANDTGLLGVLLAAMLLALSNDLALRRLGTPRWKSLQRWNYALFALVVLHGAIFQLLERRRIPFVVVFAGMCAAVIVVQLAGARARRRAQLRPIAHAGRIGYNIPTPPSVTEKP